MKIEQHLNPTWSINEVLPPVSESMDAPQQDSIEPPRSPQQNKLTSEKPPPIGLRGADLQPFLRPVDKDMHEMRLLMMDATAPSTFTVGDSHGPQGNLAADAWSAGDGQIANVGGNRGGMAVMATPPGQDASFGLYQNIRYAGGAFIVPVGQLDGGALNFRSDMFGGTGWLGVGGTVLWHGANNTWGGVGAAAWLEATTGMRIVGQYQGPVKAMQGKYLVEWKQKLGPGAVVDVAFGQHLFGVAVKLFFNGNRSVSYRSFMPEERVRALLQRESRKLRILRNAGTAMKVLRSPVKVPSKKAAAQVHGPQQLGVGESLRMVLGGTFILGTSVGSYGGRAGVHATYAGEIEYFLDRTDEDHLELRIKPKNLKAIAINADAVVFAEAYHIRTLVLALEQGFRVDLRAPSARQWLDKALAGRIGGSLGKPSHIKAGDPHALHKQFAEGLPEGVERTAVAKDELHSGRTGAGIPRPFFTNQISGFGREKTSFNDRHVRTDGASTYRARHMGTTHETQKTYWGTHRVRISAEALQQVMTDADGHVQEPFVGLAMQAHFDFEHLRGNSALTPMAQTINRALGTDLAAYHERGRGLDYHIALRRTLRGPDLRALATVTPEAVVAAATASGARTQDLQVLVHQLKTILVDAPSDGPELDMPLATAVQKYLSSHRLAGLGAVHRLLGAEKKTLQVMTDSSATDGAMQAFTEALVRFSTPGADSQAALKTFARAEGKLDTAIRACNDNQVLRWFDAEAFQQNLTALLQARTQLRAHRQRVVADLSVAK